MATELIGTRVELGKTFGGIPIYEQRTADGGSVIWVGEQDPYLDVPTMSSMLAGARAGDPTALAELKARGFTLNAAGDLVDIPPAQ